MPEVSLRVERKRKVEKPAYSVPTLAEIAKIPANGYNVVSTFTGAGGSSLGFRMAGYRIVYANEFIEAARETYRANFSTPIDERDIREVTGADIRERIGDVEIDVLEGSPPCASFSVAGKREEHWGKVKKYSDTKQRTDDLFFEYARLVKELQPRVFVAENVAGLLRGTAKGYFKEILKTLKECGYRVEAKLLDAQWLGVPQARARVIFIGVRNDLGLVPVFPRPLPYRYSLKDAIPWAVAQERIAGSFTQEWSNVDRPAYTVMQNGSVSKKHSAYSLVEVATDISKYAIGREWNNLEIGEQSKRYFSLVRPSLNIPCPTITQRGGNNTVASVVHPTERRKFSIVELKAICSFPGDFVLTGTFAQQWERLGRAVPPLMMFAIARTIRDEILCKLKTP